MASKPKFARSEDFKTPRCRVSFAQNLFKPRKNDAGVDKWGCTLIFPKSVRAELEKHVAQVIKDQWGDKGIEKAKAGLIKSPFLAGDGKEARNKETGELHPGMGPDVFFIRVQSNQEPVVRYKSPSIPATEDEVWSGCYGFAVVNAYAWNNPQNGDGVSFGIQFFQRTGGDEATDRIAGRGAFNAEKWAERIDDNGDAPDTGGAGAGGLFGD
jgi:hypothetical protein